MTIQATLFDAAKTDRQVELSELNPTFVQNLSERQLLWVDVTDLKRPEIERLQPIFNLCRQSVTNLLTPLSWPRFDNYGDKYFQMNVIAIKNYLKPRLTETSLEAAPALLPENPAGASDQPGKLTRLPKTKSSIRPKTGTKIESKTEKCTYLPLELDIICGKSYVLTLHEEAVEFLDSFSEHLQNETQVGELDELAFLAALLDWQLASYLEVTTELELEIDQLDESALSPVDSRDFLERLSAVRRKVSEVRRLLNPHRQAFSMLARPDFEVVAKSTSASYFHNLNNRLERVIDMVENVREMVIGSFDLYMTGTAQNTNETMKLLTVGTIILGVIASIAGIMGVNFEMDMFKSGVNGFLIMLGITFGLVLIILVIARHRRWL